MDYFANGEARSLMAYIGHAQSEEALRASASQVLGNYYARGLNIAQGVIENHVTLMVFPQKTFELVRGMNDQASMRGFGLVSFNSS